MARPVHVNRFGLLTIPRRGTVVKNDGALAPISAGLRRPETKPVCPPRNGEDGPTTV
jgi:hypothetical protein